MKQVFKSCWPKNINLFTSKSRFYLLKCWEHFFELIKLNSDRWVSERLQKEPYWTFKLVQKWGQNSKNEITDAAPKISTRVSFWVARAGCLALAAVGDDDLLGGLPALGAERLNLLDYVHALNNLRRRIGIRNVIKPHHVSWTFFSAAKRCRAIYVSLISYKISEFKLIYPSPKYRLFYICFAVMLVSDKSDTIARMGQISSRLSDFPENGNIRIKAQKLHLCSFCLSVEW